GLKNPTQPPGRSPWGKTSLMRIAGFEPLPLRTPTTPPIVALISVLPDASARISAVVPATIGDDASSDPASPAGASTTATTSKLEFHVTGPTSTITAPNSSRATAVAVSC